MTPEQLNRLRDLAAAATPGPYVAEEYAVHQDGRAAKRILAIAVCLRAYREGYGGSRNVLRSPELKRNAAYFAACDPATITALLDRLTLADAVVEKARAMLSERVLIGDASSLHDALAAYDAAVKP